MKDTSAPDMTIKVTGYQWKWDYDYLQEGIGFYSNALHAARADREPRAEGRALPARGRQPAGRAGRHEGARADHRRRRDPRLVGAGVRRQAGRDSRLRPRHCGSRPRRPAPTAASARSSAARSTASCRSWSRSSRRTTTRKWVGEQKKQIAAAADDPNKIWDAGRPDGARREGLRRELRRLPPGDRQGHAARVPGARRLEGRASARRTSRSTPC